MLLPRFGEWETKYGGRGLVVVGVHSPETDTEAEVDNVRAYVADNHIGWRVVLDPYLDAWRRFKVAAWPTVVLIDRAGVVRGVHVGEDGAGDLEDRIAALL